MGNNELDNIENAEDEKGFLENVKTASLRRTDDSDFLDATRCDRQRDVCFAGLVDKTCCGFPGCECKKTSLTFCQFLCKYNVADCSENCQTKYEDDKFGNFLCDNIDVGTTECLQPRRGVFLDGFITPVLKVGDLVLNEPSNEEGILVYNEPSNEEECKVELYKNSPTYEGFTYIIDANTNVKTCHFYKKAQLKTNGWLRFVASNVLNTDYMNAISFLDDSTNSPSNSPSATIVDPCSACNESDRNINNTNVSEKCYNEVAAWSQQVYWSQLSGNNIPEECDDVRSASTVSANCKYSLFSMLKCSINPCEDDYDNKFKYVNDMYSCKQLNRLKKKYRRRICKKEESARKLCAVICKNKI